MAGKWKEAVGQIDEKWLGQRGLDTPLALRDRFGLVGEEVARVLAESLNDVFYGMSGGEGSPVAWHAGLMRWRVEYVPSWGAVCLRADAFDTPGPH
jgi:hypothetical protein